MPCQHHGGHVPDDLLLLTFRHGREPLLQTQLPLATEEQHEAHLTTQEGIVRGEILARVEAAMMTHTNKQKSTSS